MPRRPAFAPYSTAVEHRPSALIDRADPLALAIEMGAEDVTNVDPLALAMEMGAEDVTDRPTGEAPKGPEPPQSRLDVAKQFPALASRMMAADVSDRAPSPRPAAADPHRDALPAAGVDEPGFQRWYAGMARRYDLDANPDAPDQFYDYRAAYRAGASPGPDGHWPSQFKRPGHPNEVVGGFNTRTGQRVPGTPRASEGELVARGWAPETAKRLAATPEPGDPNTPRAKTMGDLLSQATGIEQGDPERTTWRMVSEAPSRVVRALAAGLVNGEQQWWGMLQGITENLGLTRLSEMYRTAGDEAQAMRDKVAPNPRGLGFTEAAAYSGVESIGATAPTLAAGAVMGPAASLALMGGMTAGGSYRQARQQGASPERAAVFAAVDGIVEAATERIPVTTLFDDVLKGSGVGKVLLHQLAEEIPNEQIATLLQDANAWANLPENRDKPFSAYVAERPSAAAQTFIATLTATVGQSAAAVGAERLLRPRSSADVVREGVGGAAAREVTSEAVARATEPTQSPEPAATVDAPVISAATDARSNQMGKQEVSAPADMPPVAEPAPQPTSGPPTTLPARVDALLADQPNATVEDVQTALHLRNASTARTLIEDARRRAAGPSTPAPGVSPEQAEQLQALGYDPSAMTLVDAQQVLRNAETPAASAVPTNVTGAPPMSPEGMRETVAAVESDPALKARRDEMAAASRQRTGKPPRTKAADVTPERIEDAPRQETTAQAETLPAWRGRRNVTAEGAAQIETARVAYADAINATYDTPKARADAIVEARDHLAEVTAEATSEGARVRTGTPPRRAATPPALDDTTSYLLRWLASDLRELPFEQFGMSAAANEGRFEAQANRSRGTPLQEMFKAAGVSAPRAAVAYDLERYLSGQLPKPTKAVEAALRMVPVLDAAWDGDRFNWDRVSDAQLAAAGFQTRKDLRSPVTLPPQDGAAASRFTTVPVGERAAVQQAERQQAAAALMDAEERGPVAEDADVSFDTEALDTPQTDDEVRAATLARVAADLDGYVDRYLAQPWGTVLNADNASELFPEYAASAEARATRVKAVRPAASKVVEAAFTRLLAAPLPAGTRKLVLFTSGGNASGKSTSIDPKGAQAITWDTTASSLAPTQAKIDEALDAGFRVLLRHVSRDPAEAFAAALVRAAGEGNGRTVTIGGVAQTHKGSRDVLVALADRYAGDPRVEFEVKQNTAGGLVTRDLDWLRAQEYPTGDGLRATLRAILDSARDDGAITEAVYRGALGEAGVVGGRASGERAERSDLPREDSGPRAEAEPRRRDAPVAAPADDVAAGTPLEQHARAITALRNGELSLDAYRAAFARFDAAADAIQAALADETKDALLKRLGPMGQARYRSEKKAATVAAVFHDLIADYVTSGAVSYDPFSKGGYLGAVRKAVAETTEADLEAYAKKVAEARKAHRARVDAYKKAITNPETLDEFNTLVRAHKQGEAGLTPEQRVRYDELRAEKGRDDRKAERATAPTVEAASQQTTATIVETTHTRDKYPLFVVKLADRVSREDYAKLLTGAKRLGGWYSAFRGNGAVPGFQFKSRESAEAFQQLAQAGDTQAVKTAVVERREEKAETSKSAAADRLLDMAEKLEGQGNDDLGKDRLANTARRARMASAADADARGKVALARTMRNLATALQHGDAPALEGIRHRSQVEAMNAVLVTAQYDEARAQGMAFTDEQMDKIRANVGPEVLARVTLPQFRIPSDHVQRVLDKIEKLPGAKRLAARVRKAAGGEWYKPSKDDAADLLANAKRVGEDLWQLREALEKRSRFEAMGITDDATMRTAMRQFVQFREDGPKKDRVKELERDLAGNKGVGFDFFPTPKPLAERMAKALDVQPGMRVLEPSAGKGNLADAVRAVAPEATIETVEQSSTLRDILEAKGYALVGRDFTDFTPDEKYDRIIMNPPFSDGIDADHVRRAYDMLAPGGKLLAITGEGIFSRSDKKAAAFRDWFESVGGASERMEGAFLDRTEANTTSVVSRLLTIEKPAAESAEPQPFSAESVAEAFGLPDEQGAAIAAFSEAMGLPADRIAIVKGGTPRDWALSQSPDDTRAVLTGRQGGPSGPKASVEFTGLPWLADSKILIRALTNPDVSSPVHELAHVARRWLLNRDVPAEKRRGISDEDIATVEQWAGATDGQWDRAAEEKFARGLERYVREGGPTLPSTIRDVFAKLAAWLTDVYQSIAGSPIDVEITPEMRAVFDRLVTRKERLAAEREKASPPTKKKSGPPRQPKTLAPGSEVVAGRDGIPSAWQREATPAERAVIFTPGHLVDAYEGVDRVVAYTADEPWSVTVQREGEEPRTHATNPRVVKAEYVDRAKAITGHAKPRVFTVPEATPAPKPSGPPRKTASDEDTFTGPSRADAMTKRPMHPSVSPALEPFLRKLWPNMEPERIVHEAPGVIVHTPEDVTKFGLRIEVNGDTVTVTPIGRKDRQISNFTRETMVRGLKAKRDGAAFRAALMSEPVDSTRSFRAAAEADAAIRGNRGIRPEALERESGLPVDVRGQELDEEGTAPIKVKVDPSWRQYRSGDYVRLSDGSTARVAVEAKSAFIGIQVERDGRRWTVRQETVSPVDALDTGEQQDRLPGDVGDVRDEERAQPTEDVPEQTLQLRQQQVEPEQAGLGLDPIGRVEQKARQRLKDRGTTDVLFQNDEPLPLPVDDRDDLLVIGAAKIARGQSREAWNAAMVREFGAAVRPVLDALYREAKTRADAAASVDIDDYFNLRRIDVSTDEKAELSAALLETIYRTGRVPKERESWETIRAEAAAMAPEVLEQLQPFQQMQAPFRAVRLIARQRINALNEAIYQGRMALEGVPGDSPEALQRERVLAEKERDLQGLLDTWMRLRSEDGRNLAMHRMMVGSVESWYQPEFWVSKARRELGLPVGTQLPIDVFRALQDILHRGRHAAETGQPVEPIQLELSRYLTRLRKSTWLEVISAVRKAGLLTGPKTHARNVLGNLAFAALEELSRAPAVVIDFAVGAATGHRTVHGISPRAMASSSMEAATKGLEQARDILRSGSTADALLRVDASRELNSGIRWLDTYVNTVFRGMGATDRVFKSYAFRRSLEEQAALQAVNEGRSPIEILAAPSAEMLARAVADAEFATFNNQNIAAEFLAQGKAALRRHGPSGQAAAFVIDLAVPFANTPSNILARMLDYTPAGATKAIAKAAVRRAVDGALTADQQRLFALGLGRGAVGSALIYLGWTLAAAGAASGMGGDDEGERNVKEAAGILPGAVRVGGRWHQIATFSPAGNLVSLGASLYHTSTMRLRDELARGGKVLGIAGRLALEQPMLKGLNDIIQALQRPDTYAEGAAAAMAGSFVPTLVNDLASAFDPYRRDTRPEGGFRQSLWTGVAARLPGVRNLLPARKTVFGDEQQQTARAIWDPTIATVARDLTDPVLRELVARDVGLSWPRQAQGETADDYQQRIKKTGDVIKGALARLVASPGYQRLSAERKAEALEDAIDQARRRVRPKKNGPPRQRPRFQ